TGRLNLRLSEKKKRSWLNKRLLPLLCSSTPHPPQLILPLFPIYSSHGIYIRSPPLANEVPSRVCQHSPNRV
ncbi:hypothetical protein L208DRAFT_1403180, partial [Tricholoma matsutake]